jgi:hypothetical protein
MCCFILEINTSVQVTHPVLMRESCGSVHRLALFPGVKWGRKNFVVASLSERAESGEVITEKSNGHCNML